MSKPHLGKGLKFPIDGKFEVSEGIDKLLEDIQTLLLTNFQERVMRPTLGCGLMGRIWENIDTAAIYGASDISTALEKFEPRISLIDISTAIDRPSGIILFTINFIVLDSNTEVNLVFPFKPSSQLSIRS
jgi:phage baseplate assembly protein W